MEIDCDCFSPDECEQDAVTTRGELNLCAACADAHDNWADRDRNMPSFDDQLWAKVGRGW